MCATQREKKVVEKFEYVNTTPLGDKKGACAAGAAGGRQHAGLTRRAARVVVGWARRVI